MAYFIFEALLIAEKKRYLRCIVEDINPRGIVWS